MDPLNKTKQTNKSKYVKLDHHEHVLARPGMYIGSIDPDTYNTWVYESKDSENELVKKEVSIVPGLYKIFDEILVNAIDHVTRLKIAKNKDDEVQPVKNIKVTIDKESGEISVYNDGDGIDVEIHPEYNIYIPELIFGHLLTSTNYDDTEEKIVGGLNGLGSKVTSLYSKFFKIETIDARKKKFYSQEWTDNMYNKSKPIVKASSKKPYTCVTFIPDYERFKLKKGLTNDIYSLFVKRVYDICALTDNDVNVYFNGEKLEYKTFEKYVDLYIGAKNKNKVYEKINDRWEVIATSSPDMGFDQVSFVNGIWTIRGGKHVDYITNQITNGIAEIINKKKKDANMKSGHIRNYLMIFVKCTIGNPSFDSQTKDLLTTPISKFGSKAEISQKFLEKLYNTDIVQKALELASIGNQKALKKTDGKKTSKLRGIVKLDDANNAGTAKSSQCSLILTEGDSAKSTALAGLAVVGRDNYGVFPLRGKLLNVKDASVKKLLENEEIQAIKKILGLETGKTYKSVDDLRYGRVILMTDSDEDGSHIRGLLMNFFHTLWPSLIPKDFISSLLTPIIKVTNNTNNETHSFYNHCDYDEWIKSKNKNLNSWTIKYYKGLGTSNEEEAKSYFRNMRRVDYKSTGKNCDEAIDLAFNKKRADDRKQWLGTYKSTTCVKYDKMNTDVTYNDFINKELIHFSVYDLKRSIPSLVDGLKPSQRKILFCCFKRNLTKETKVAQLSGYVSEHAAYHHGEASLQGAIICMAQNFVGANNLNLLKPNGQFGCLDPETEVLTWNSIKKAKDIVMGDILVGDDGTPRYIRKLTSGFDQMYKVNMPDFGVNSSFKVNSKHILTLFHRSSSKLVDINIQNFLHLKPKEREQYYAIKSTAWIKWNKRTIDKNPYDIGIAIAKDTFNKDTAMRYIFNDKETRKMVLAGIIDNKYEYVEDGINIPVTYNNKNLIKLLASSLGFMNHESFDLSNSNNKSIIIKGRGLSELPTCYRLLTSKLLGQTLNISKITIEQLDIGPFCGWSIDGNERFLLADFTITHNSRILGGKDASAPRYIFTELNPLTRQVFKKEDEAQLNYLNDDGLSVEPEYYVPIVPMILINGTIGIGTGFSTNIPSYNPIDVVNACKHMIKHNGKSDSLNPLKPWIRGFKGTIEVIKLDEDTNKQQFMCTGVYRKINDNTIEITELPVGVWTEDYKAFLEDYLDKNPKILKDYESHYTTQDVCFKLHFHDSSHFNIKDFKLQNKILTSNMHLFDSENIIKKYDTVENILEEFYVTRLKHYNIRKELVIKNMNEEMKEKDEKRRFIENVIKKVIPILGVKKVELESLLTKMDFIKIDDSFNYLLNMPIQSLTAERAELLSKEVIALASKIKEYEAIPVSKMWETELDTFINAYDKDLKDYNDHIKHHKEKPTKTKK